MTRFPLHFLQRSLSRMKSPVPPQSGHTDCSCWTIPGPIGRWITRIPEPEHFRHRTTDPLVFPPELLVVRRGDGKEKGGKREQRSLPSAHFTKDLSLVLDRLCGTVVHLLKGYPRNGVERPHSLLLYLPLYKLLAAHSKGMPSVSPFLLLRLPPTETDERSGMESARNLKRKLRSSWLAESERTTYCQSRPQTGVRTALRQTYLNRTQSVNLPSPLPSFTYLILRHH